MSSRSGDLLIRVQFVGDFLPFHAGQLSQTHLYNCLCLLLGQPLLVFQLVALHIVLCTVEES